MCACACPSVVGRLSRSHARTHAPTADEASGCVQASRTRELLRFAYGSELTRYLMGAGGRTALLRLMAWRGGAPGTLRCSATLAQPNLGHAFGGAARSRCFGFSGCPSSSGCCTRSSATTPRRPMRLRPPTRVRASGGASVSVACKRVCVCAVRAPLRALLHLRHDCPLVFALRSLLLRTAPGPTSSPPPAGWP